jgi:large subunit ribosomal protein L21
MYAVVKSGGKQYRVTLGDTIEVEKLEGGIGDTVTLTPVLLMGRGSEVTIGNPHLPNTHVEAQIVAQKRGDKIIIFKHKRRKNYRRKQGHRQYLTSLRITGINASTADSRDNSEV